MNPQDALVTGGMNAAVAYDPSKFPRRCTTLQGGSRSWTRSASARVGSSCRPAIAVRPAYGPAATRPRGVHKAPANEKVTLGVNGLGFQVTGEEQGGLNQRGINCIRAFPGRGIRIWGARTMSSDPEWRYVNVRRLFNYISESIMEGTQWAVFEPNVTKAPPCSPLGASSAGNLPSPRTWRQGALFGATPQEAFFVKCDAETNPQDVIEAGQVVVEIGICPVKPAEFVIFRISQFAAGASEIS